MSHKRVLFILTQAADLPERIGNVLKAHDLDSLINSMSDPADTFEQLRNIVPDYLLIDTDSSELDVPQFVRDAIQINPNIFVFILSSRPFKIDPESPISLHVADVIHVDELETRLPYRIKFTEQQYRGDNTLPGKLFRHNPDALLVVDDDAIIVDLNEAACDLFELGREHLIDKSALKLSMLENHGKLIDDWKRFLQRKTARSRLIVKGLDGSDRYIDYSARANIEPGKHLLSFRLISTAPVERLPYRTDVLRYITDAVFIVDRQKRVQFWNTGAEKLYELPHDQAVGQNVEEVFKSYPASYQHHPQFDEYFMETTSWYGEQIHVKKNGNQINVDVTISPIIDDDDFVDGLLFIVRDITMRKTILGALQESEQKFRQIADNINEVFWLHSLDYSKIYYISSAYEKIWGKKVKSLYEQPHSWLDAVHPQDHQYLKQVITENQGQPHDVEFRIIKPDGGLCWIRNRSFPIHNLQGEVYRMASISEDITDRKWAEEKQEQDHARYRTLVEEQSDLICCFLPNGALTIVNEAYCNFVGFLRDELIGEPFLLFRSTAADDVLREQIQELTVDNPILTLTDSARTHDGKMHWLNWTIRAISDEFGNISEFQAVGRDVTQHKSKEHELLSLRQAIENVQLGVTVTDTEGRIIYTNPIEARMHGYRVDELIGQDVRIFAPPNLANKLSESEIRDLRKWQRKSINVRKDGSVFAVKLISSSVINPQGEAIGVVTISEEILNDLFESETISEDHSYEIP